MTLIESIVSVLPNVPFLPPSPPANADNREREQKSPLNRFLGEPFKKGKGNGNDQLVSANQQQSR